MKFVDFVFESNCHISLGPLGNILCCFILLVNFKKCFFPNAGVGLLEK